MAKTKLSLMTKSSEQTLYNADAIAASRSTIILIYAIFSPCTPVAPGAPI
jgi:hypothetical protein